MVLAANGPAFCAGHDLKELTGRRSDADGGRAYFQQIMNTCSAMMQQIVALPQPVIAAVQGVASAAGCQLVASCDLAVASAKAGFATPGVDIGLFCSTPMVALSRNVARKHAMEMLLTGDIVAAEKAAAIGLVNEVVAGGPGARPGDRAREQIASKSSHVVGIGKAAFYRQIELPLAEAYDYASKVMTENMMARDAEEGICAFIEKRDPSWEDADDRDGGMNHDNYPDTYIRGILNTVKSIAMVGISPKDNRPSYFAFKYLLERGYRMIPVNPGQAGKEILGQKVYAKLADIPEPVDMVDVFRASQFAGAVVDEALAMTPPPAVIWMQLGVRNDEAAAKAEAAGLKVVMNRCPKIEYGRLSSEIGWIGVNSRTLSSKRAPLLGKGMQRMSLNRSSSAGGSTRAADQAAERAAQNSGQGSGSGTKS